MGQCVKKINYKDDKIVGPTTEYFQNGNVHYICKLQGKYIKVADNEGKDLLDAKGNGLEFIFDTVNNRKITRFYAANELVYSAYLDSSNNRIFQYCNSNATISFFKFFQSRMKKNVKFPVEEFKGYNHGLVLLKFVIDSSGNTRSYEIIKGLGELFDKQLLSFLGSDNSNLKWNAPLHSNRPCFQEIIVPVLFEIEPFKRKNTNYNMYNSSYWMWQQQMNRTNFTPPKIPATPSYNFR